MLRTLRDRLRRRLYWSSFQPKPFDQWGLWPRLAVVLSGSFVLLFAIFSLLSLQAIEDSTNRVLEERRVIAEMAAVEIDGLFNRAIYELEIATDFATFDPHASNFSAESHMLAHAYGRIGTFSLGVAFLDDSGHVVLAEPYELSAQGADWSKEPYIRRALTTGERQISTPFVDPRTQLPAVAIAVPIHDSGGGMMSVLAGLIDLTNPEIRKSIEKAEQLGHTGHALVVNQTGQIVVSTQPGQFLTSGEHPAFYREMLMSHQRTVQSVPTNGAQEGQRGERYRQHIMAFVPLETAPWGIAVGGDAAEILAPVDRLRNGILLLGTLSLGVVLGATLLGARRLVRPVNDLTHAAQRIARGDLEHAITLDEGGEIGLLAQNLESMRGRLAASFREIQAWNNELEARVQRRTQELEALNATLRQQEATRRQLLARVITAQEEERMRIAQELHDGTGQVLASLVISLEGIERSLPFELATTRKHVLRSRDLVAQTVTDIRRLMADLRPGALDELGLAAAIRWCAENHLEPLGIAYEVQTQNLRDERLPSTVETVLFRIAQEAIGNTVRHADASQMTISLEQRNDALRLQIEDNGKGFDPEDVHPSRDGTHGLGLAGMRERAALLEGQVRIDSRAGQGTRIQVMVPLLEEVGA